MNPFEMVVLIVAITAFASIMRARFGVTKNREGDEVLIRTDADAARLRDEVKMLKDRIAVLERLATDDNSARNLDREIDRLR